MVEWFKALVLKTSEVQASVGSNPTVSEFKHRISGYLKSGLIFHFKKFLESNKIRTPSDIFSKLVCRIYFSV